MELYIDKDENFYGWHKEGTYPTTQERYEDVMKRKDAEYEALPEVKKERAQTEVDSILDDMSIAEAMYYILQYIGAKTSKDQEDPSVDQVPTPTGENIIAWGDRVVGELDVKIRKLRGI